MKKIVLLTAVAFCLPGMAFAARITTQNSLNNSPIGVGETAGSRGSFASPNAYSSAEVPATLPGSTGNGNVPATLPGSFGGGGNDYTPEPTVPDDESAKSDRSASMLMFVGSGDETSRADQEAPRSSARGGASAPSGLYGAEQNSQAAPVESPLAPAGAEESNDVTPPTYPVR